MATYDAPTTELDAINIMISAVGEAPVSTLTGTISPTVAMARNILKETAKSIQSRGWHFNTEKEVELARDTDNKIPVTGNMVSVDLDTDTYPRGDYDITRRGAFLYDLIDHTFVFTENLDATVVYLLPLADVPETCRYYIAVTAARRLQARHAGSEKGHAFTKADELDAKQDFETEDNRNADHTIFDDAWSSWARSR